MRWSEIDFEKRLLVIPAERMKSDAGHVVPLSGPVIHILRTLPHFTGDYVFSTCYGKKPINGFSKCKVRLDVAMTDILREGLPADKRGDFVLHPFVLHDVRRTMRSALSGLPIEQHVRELTIGHKQQGLHKVYDLYAYVEEKRRALDLWAARLMSIVTEPPPNVVEIAARRTLNAV